DIFSGLFETQTLFFNPENPSVCDVISGDGSVSVGACLPGGTDYTNWFQANVQPALDQAKRDVFAMMPVFDVQTMIDTLYSMRMAGRLSRAPARRFIPARAPICASTSRMEARRRAPRSRSTPATARSAQSWHYNRQTQEIVETSSGMCLDVRYDG